MADIFLSYSSEDRDRVEPLVRAFEAAGWSVWWERKTPVDKPLDDETKRELESAKCVVVVWSTTSIVSKSVRKEATSGKLRGIIAPVRIDPVDPPIGFRRLKFADLVGVIEYSTNTVFKHFLESVGRMIARGARPPAPLLPPPPAPMPDYQPQKSSPAIEPQPDAPPDVPPDPPIEGGPPIGIFIVAFLAIGLIGRWIMSNDRPPQLPAAGTPAPAVQPERVPNQPVPPVKSTVTVTLHLPNEKKIYFEMVPLPAGRFMMGSPLEEDKRAKDEGPQHRVNLRRFEIGKYEVTQALWRAVMGTDPSWFKGDDLPVENVSWNASREFCRYLNVRLGLTGSNGYRLPTEAEWEYAARAGTTTPFAFGETIAPDIVNYNGRHPYGDAPKGVYRGKTVPVGSLGPANARGIYDMHGNVWEWVEDQYHDSYIGAPYDGRAWTGLEQSAPRVYRGGSWFADAFECRSANRLHERRGFQQNHLGFRLARTLP